MSNLCVALPCVLLSRHCLPGQATLSLRVTGKGKSSRMVGTIHSHSTHFSKFSSGIMLFIPGVVLHGK